MENGTLIITKSKKGKFNGKIEYTKSNGKSGIFIITASLFLSDDLNGKKCEFERLKGALAKLFVDEKQIYPDPKRKIQHTKIISQNTIQNSKGVVFEELFDANETCLPKDTLNLLLNSEIDNYSLKLNKAAYYQKNTKTKDKFIFFEAGRKRTDLDKLVLPNFGNINFESFKNKYDKLNYDKRTLDLILNWRMAVGLGHESVYETSITLHHIYGIPYISASSIKGVVRSWIITEVFGQNDLKNAEGNAIENKGFCDVFGCSAELKVKQKDGTKKTFQSFYTRTEGKRKGDRIGKITFFDAFPIKEPTIEPDIMNVHYNDYYNGDNPPTDYQNPVPIFFLTVKDTLFKFVIGSKKEPLDNFKIDGHFIDWWLKQALENHGIGAKTAVGYGRMTETN